MSKDTLYVNLWAAPCMGKSGTMGLVYGGLKALHVSAEPVHEVAKELLWQGILHLTSQFDIAEEQFRREDRLRGIVDVAISDSPVLMGVLHEKKERAKLEADIRAKIAGRREMNYVIYRDLSSNYEQVGRTETPEQSLAHHTRVLELIRSYDPAVRIVPTELAADIIIADVLAELGRARHTTHKTFSIRATSRRTGAELVFDDLDRQQCAILVSQLERQGYSTAADVRDVFVAA